MHNSFHLYCELRLEASAIEPMPETAAASNEAVHPDPAAIESSHEENLIVQRNLKNLTATVSVTSLATSFTFVPAVVKETVTNVAQAAALYCLPAGYIVCWSIPVHSISNNLFLFIPYTYQHNLFIL